MKILLPVSAIYHGGKICFLSSSTRKLCYRPWIIGIFTYLISSAIAIYLHGRIVDYFVNEQSTILGYLLYVLTWLVAAVSLVVASLVITLTLVLAITSVYQSSIATDVLRLRGIQLPAEPEGITGAISETKRTIVTELKKLGRLSPLVFLLVIVGFIPILAPVALLISSWVLGFQFVDVVLDLYKIPAKERFRFGRTNKLLLVSFGASLSLIACIPFVGILLPPIATASAAWMLAENSIQDKLPR